MHDANEVKSFPKETLRMPRGVIVDVGFVSKGFVGANGPCGSGCRFEGGSEIVGLLDWAVGFPGRAAWLGWGYLRQGGVFSVKPAFSTPSAALILETLCSGRML
jgi:hypothetical protein